VALASSLTQTKQSDRLESHQAQTDEANRSQKLKLGVRSNRETSLFRIAPPWNNGAKGEQANN
jgi:hypothetical protein